MTKGQIRCTSLPTGDVLQTFAVDAHVPEFSRPVWVPLGLGPGSENLYLLHGPNPTSAAPEPYSHHFDNGTRHWGTFLGYRNVTTWAFRRVYDTTGFASYRIRLLVAGHAPLQEDEFAGFIRAGLP